MDRLQALRCHRRRHTQGLGSYYLELLDAQRSLFGVRQAVAQTRVAVLQNQVVLYKALGGGALACSGDYEAGVIGA